MHISAKKNTGIASAYATRIDFCRVLRANIKPLYLLAFLLTANHAVAQECVIETVDAVMDEQRVFREWGTGWIKRTLIRTAISKVFAEEAGISSPRRTPTPTKEKTGEPSCGSSKAELEATIISVTSLPLLDRFVFVMSVLEGYSVRECSVLLNCSPTAVLEARIHALLMLPVLQTSDDSDPIRELHRSTASEATETLSPGGLGRKPQIDPAMPSRSLSYEDVAKITTT
jgi:DNA-directed RNA polymerase specialized sigma24 family protein